MKRGVDLLNEQGVLVFIIPSSFLNNGRSYAKEEIINNGGELVAAYRLPEGMFEDTTIGTDIVIIQKTGQGYVGNMINNSYFSDNPGNIIGEIQTRKNKYGRMEEFVSGEKQDVTNLLEKIGKDYAELADSRRQQASWEEEVTSQQNDYSGSQYDTNLIKAFNAIENVKNKVVKQEVLDTYDSIELNAKKNKLFQSFVDSAMEHIGNLYQDTVSEMSVQELYYQMVDTKGPNRSALNYEKTPKKPRKINVKSEVQQIETLIPEKTIQP